LGRRSLQAETREGSDTDDDENKDPGILDTVANTNQADDDALWQGQGRGRRHVAYVDAHCLRCGVVQAVASENSSFTCPSRHSQDFFRCFDCKGTFQRADVGDRCPWCLSGQLDGRVTSWDWAADQRRHPERVARPSKSVEIGHSGADTDRRFLSGFILAACGGSGIPVNATCDIDFAQDGITIRGPYLVNESVRHEDVAALQVTGSTMRRSAGVFGGGFGVIGAAEGILAAAVINSLTTRTKIYTVLRIATTKSEYVFVSYKLDSDAVEMSLVPVQLRIRRAKAAGQNPVSEPSPSSGTIADELTRLARLRQSGALDDAEFRSAKARLLRDP
jgi:Short C-terminal domain